MANNGTENGIPVWDPSGMIDGGLWSKRPFGEVR